MKLKTKDVLVLYFLFLQEKKQKERFTRAKEMKSSGGNLKGKIWVAESTFSCENPYEDCLLSGRVLGFSFSSPFWAFLFITEALHICQVE